MVDIDNENDENIVLDIDNDSIVPDPCNARDPTCSLSSPCPCS